MDVFEWVASIFERIVDNVVTALILPLVTWLLGVFNGIVPGAARAKLFVRNIFLHRIGNIGRSKRHSSHDRFLFVLCWLDGDRYGHNTKIVAKAFREVPGVKLVRSARIVKAEGAGDDWRPAMREQANAILRNWRGDLAIVGAVERPGENLSLWFVPRRGDGTLGRIEQQFALSGAMLGEDFRETLHDQIVAVALSTVTPLASNEARGRILEDSLKQVVEKLGILLDSGEITAPLHRAGLRATYGRAFFALGERESRTARIEEAVTSYREALQEFTPENAPLNWAEIQNDLGNALTRIGERESGTTRLKEAVEAYRKALQEFTPENAPLHWATTQNNLGAALTCIGERESGTMRFKEAVEAYRGALKEYARENAPLDWAMTQNNLGNALASVGERESGTTRFEEAVEAYRGALKEYTRESAPFNWATTQNNIGTALARIGECESGTARLKEAVTAFQNALKERTRENAPFNWAETQNNLGAALASIGKRESGIARLEEAATAYNNALTIFDPARTPIHWEASYNALEKVRAIIRQRFEGSR